MGVVVGVSWWVQVEEFNYGVRCQCRGGDECMWLWLCVCVCESVWGGLLRNYSCNIIVLVQTTHTNVPHFVQITNQPDDRYNHRCLTRL